MLERAVMSPPSWTVSPRFVLRDFIAVVTTSSERPAAYLRTVFSAFSVSSPPAVASHRESAAGFFL